MLLADSNHAHKCRVADIAVRVWSREAKEFRCCRYLRLIEGAQVPEATERCRNPVPEYGSCELGRAAGKMATISTKER